MFRRKVDYEGDTNKENHGSDYSPSETEICKKNWPNNMKMKRMKNSKKILLR